jgi:hypothetical protein
MGCKEDSTEFAGCEGFMGCWDGFIMGCIGVCGHREGSWRAWGIHVVLGWLYSVLERVHEVPGGCI